MKDKHFPHRILIAHAQRELDNAKHKLEELERGERGMPDCSTDWSDYFGYLDEAVRITKSIRDHYATPDIN